MAKIKFKFKKSWKSILAIGLTVVLGIGAIFGITRLVDKQEETHKEISPKYTVGGLSTDGKYVETEESIYTKTAFECQGLKITPDFDSSVSYQVFFYDLNEQFLESTATMTEFYEGAPLLAKYARIEITPNEDEKVSWYEVNKYAKQITVEVLKEQNFKLVDYFVVDPDMTGKCYIGHGVGEELTVNSHPEYGCIEFIDVSEMKKIRAVYADDATHGMFNYFFLDSDGKLLLGDNNNGSVSATVLDVPVGAVSFVCSYKLGQEFTINQAL